MVKADDAPKIARLAERFKFATVDKAKIEREIMEDREISAPTQPTDSAPTEQDAPDIANTEKLLDDLLGTPEGKAEPDIPESEKFEPKKTESVIAESEVKDDRPLPTGGKSRNPSEPISEHSRNSARDSSTKPSVREEMREIKASQRTKANESKQLEKRSNTNKHNRNRVTTHKQIQSRKRLKSMKSKGNR
jgi:hypothetical protein